MCAYIDILLFYLVFLNRRMISDYYAISKARRNEFDVREDEEQYEKLQNIIDLLVAAGYFRARIKALSSFDVVVGGMVWCLTLCNKSVDVDLFYTENSSIGQQISLTEKLVEVLFHLKCPHTIEPHQIQGLDFIHIFPVIQWLVKQAIEWKDKYGDSVRSYSVYNFDKRFNLLQNNLCSEFPIEEQRVSTLNRIFRRKDKSPRKDLLEDVKYTLMEYGCKNLSYRVGLQEEEIEQTFESNEFQIEEKLREDFMDTKDGGKMNQISAGDIAQFINTSEINKKLVDDVNMYLQNSCSKNLNIGSNDNSNDLQKLKEEETQLDRALIEVDEAKKKVNEEMKDIDLRLSKIRLLEDDNTGRVAKLRMLVQEYDDIKKREKDFKVNCNLELEKLEEQIMKIKRIQKGQAQTDFMILKKQYQEEQKRLIELRAEIAEINSQIARKQRYIDVIPSQLEIAQYQRRIIELFNQVGSKHRETKQLYTHHNALLDIQTYLQREIDLLCNIEDVQELTSKESYKESFIENLQQVLKGVNSSLDKLSVKKKELQVVRDKICADYQYLLEKEQVYHKTVDDFKNECQINEQLREELQKMGYELDD